MVVARHFSIRRKLRAAIDKYVFRANRTHYLKWPINDSWSVRYIFMFATQPDYEHKWILKNHDTKEYYILEKHEALTYINERAIRTEPYEYFSVIENNRYRRSIIDHLSSQSQFILE